MNAPKVYPNKAHQRAYEDGIAAARAGKPRFSPYPGDNRTSAYFRKAWLAGYDGAIAALGACPSCGGSYGLIRRDGAPVCLTCTGQHIYLYGGAP